MVALIRVTSPGGHKTDQVINSLESLTEMSQTGSIGVQESGVIDLKQELESSLESPGKDTEEPRS